MAEFFEVWKMLHSKNPVYLEEVEEGFLFGFLKMLSNSKKNSKFMRDFNCDIFKVKNKQMLVEELFYNIQPDPWCGSIKATKYDEKKLDIAKPYIKKVFGWSEREFNFQKQLIIQWIEDPVFIEELNQKVSLDKKEAKILGANYVKYKPKPKKIVKPRESASLFSF